MPDINPDLTIDQLVPTYGEFDQTSVDENCETPAEQAEQAKVLLKQWPEAPEDAQSAVAYHLASLIHFCRIYGLDWDNALQSAQNHAEAEAEGIY